MEVPDRGAVAGRAGAVREVELDLQAVTRWAADGTWDRLLGAQVQAHEVAGRLDWVVAIDSTIARVHQHGATLARDTGGTGESHESVAGAA